MKKTYSLLLFVCIVGCIAQSFAQTFNLQPPVAKIVPKVDTLHGDTRVDNYFWLRERTNPEVKKYLETENAYTDAAMKSTIALQETLYNEMLRRIKETDNDVPHREGNYYYFTRTEKGKQYPYYCRKKETLSAKEEITLDQNALAKDFRYLRLGEYGTSPNQQLLAYSLDTNGSEHFTLFVKNLATGKLLDDRILNTVDIVWAMDNQTLFYSIRDSAERAYRVYRHLLGTDAAKDPMVFEESDGLYELGINRSKSDAYIFITTAAKTSSEVLYIDASHPTDAFKVLSPREINHEYSVDHHGDFFYILTNKNAKNFRLVKAPVNNPQQTNWVDVIPHRTKVTLEGVEFFKNHFVAFERENGLQKMRVTDVRSGTKHYITFPEPVYSAFNNVNRVFDTNVFRFSYQSFTTPSSIWDYNLETKQRKLMKRTPVLGGFDASQYQSERVYAKAADGTDIPISLVYKQGVKKDGSAPLHLYGYGSYGSSTNVTFSSNRLSLLNRGVIYAIAHIRGGGDLGRDWKDNGRMMHKMNTFTDFIACAEYLIAHNYTSKEHLTMEGGSAGGLLMGAVTNMRPDLFKAVLAQVPFVDVINTMLDPGLMYTVQEFQEWGNPMVKEEYDYMKTYCPYTNVKAQAYPNILVKVGFNDPRVNYWEGTKWVAKMRAMKTDMNKIMLKVNWGAGHSGSSGRYDFLKEIAFNYAFLLSQYGISN